MSTRLVVDDTKIQIISIGTQGPQGIPGDPGSGSSEFTSLTDAPVTYAGEALKVVRVNSGETGLEFAAVSVGGGDLLSTNNLSDIANATTARTNLGLGSVNNTADSAKPVSTAQAAADLATAGYTGITWVAPSTTSGPGANGFYNNMKAANASVIPLMKQVAYHRYVNIDNTNLATLASNAEADGISTAMLEWIGATADTLYDDITTGHNSSWQQYTIAFPNNADPQNDDGGAYFTVSTTSWAVSLGKRSTYLRHFMKYIRKGAIMKGVTNSGSSKGVPFVNSNGAYVVPIKAVAESITVSGLPAGTYGIRYTTGVASNAPSAYDQALSDQTITTGQDVTFTMPAAGYATVYDVNYMNYTSAQVSGRGARLLLFG